MQTGGFACQGHRVKVMASRSWGQGHGVKVMAPERKSVYVNPVHGWVDWKAILLVIVTHLHQHFLGGWLHTEINVRHGELNPDTVTHPSTNRARRRLASLIHSFVYSHSKKMTTYTIKRTCRTTRLH